MSKSANNNLGSENMLFDLLNGFMQISQPGFQNQEKSLQQWNQFKELITNRPIDYHQVFTFISKMQETEVSSPQQQRQIQGQQQQQQQQQQTQQFLQEHEEGNEGQSSQSNQNNNNNNDPYSGSSMKLHLSQKQQNNFQSNNIKENSQSSNAYYNSSQNPAGNITNNNNNFHSQANGNSQQSQSQGRTNNFVKNTQSSYASNNTVSNNFQNGNSHSQSNNPHSSSQQQQQQQQQQINSTTSSTANNNYYNSTTNPSNNSNQNSYSNSFNNELFAGSSMNMFKTAAGNLQSNMIQNQKKGEQPRSSTRDQFNQGTSSSSQNQANNNFNGGQSMNMYSSSGNNNNPSSSRNNYRSSFNQSSSTSNTNNANNNSIQQSNQKNSSNQQSNTKNNGNISNFSANNGMANMYSSKENYSHFNNNSTNNMEKSSPMNPSKFTNSFKGAGNTHSIYNNNQSSNNNNNESVNSSNNPSSTGATAATTAINQLGQQSPEKLSSQKSFKQQQNSYQQNGNHHHNANSNNHNNQQFNIQNFHGLPQETSTFVKDDILYSIKSFSDFLKEHTRIQSLGKNTQFAQTSILELQNNSNSLLKLASIAFFVNLICELPHPESAANTTCTASKMQLIDIFLKVYNRKLKIHVSATHIFTSDQLIASFTKNTGLLIQLYLLHGQNTSKLVKAFLYQVQHDPLYLDSLVILIKEIAAEFVEECDYDAIASILMSQQQQQQQMMQKESLSSTAASFSQLENKANNLSEKERRAKLAQKLRQPSWKEVKPEWLFLLSLSLQRPIELFNLRDNKLEQTLFKSKKMQISEITSNNKINIVTVTHAENKFPVYYLMTMKLTETELYSSLKMNFKKNDLKLNEEVNFPYLLKQVTREKEQYQQSSQQQQNSSQQSQQQSQQQNTSSQQAQQQLSPSSSQQQTNQTLPQSNSNTNLTKEYSMGHRSSKLGLHLNQLQMQSQQQNTLQQSVNAASINHHHHNSSVEDQGRKSHSIKTNPISNLNSNGSASNLNNLQQIANPSASSPRMHNFMVGNNLNTLNTQQQSSVGFTGSIAQNLQSQQLPSSLNQPDTKITSFSKVASKFGTYESTSPKYNLNTLTFNKSNVTQRQHQQTNSLSQDEWNKNLLYAKMKDLIFTLNINSENLNSLARFSISNSSNGIQSKENIQPKSPLKYKSVLYPINNGNGNNNGSASNTNQQSQGGSIPPTGFSSALNNIMIGQNSLQQNPQQSSSITTASSTSTNNNLNNMSSNTTAATITSTLNNNTNNINSFISPSQGFNNYINSNPSLQAGQSPFNLNSNTKLTSNNLVSVSPSSNLGGINPILLSSTNNNNFTSSYGKNGSSNNGNSNNLQSFLNSNNFNIIQSTGMGSVANQQPTLNTLNSQNMNMSSSLNGNSTLNSNSALNQIAAMAPGTVASKRNPNIYSNNSNLVDSQSREVFISPRRNLNTQY